MPPMAQASTKRTVKRMHKLCWGSGSRRHLVSGFRVFVISCFREIRLRAGWRVTRAHWLMRMWFIRE